MFKENISPFQYFSVGDGFTCYANQNSADGKVAATLVYLPQSKKTATRRRVIDNTYHTKVVNNSCNSDHNGAKADFVKTFGTSQGDEEFFVVPESDIVQRFDANYALTEIYKQRLKKLPEEIITKTSAAIGFLLNNGFSLNNLGIYGGLQSFLIHCNQPKPTIKDVDVLIYGTEHMQKILELADKTRYLRTNPHPIRLGLDAGIRKKRHELSKIYIPGFKGELYCDIKVIRKDGDPNSVIESAQYTEKDRWIEGIVTDASEVLCASPVFKMNVGGRTITVASSSYNFIGAARKGDKVKVLAGETDVPDYYQLLNLPEQKHQVTYL